MNATVVVNNLTVVHRRSGGRSTAGPDVCMTPGPGGPVAVSYVNTAFSTTTANGSRDVTADGVPIMLKSSHFATSTGDEAGSLGGVVSGTFCGKAYPRMYSMDVRVEGEGVFRFSDYMLQNGGSPTNTPPGIETQANLSAHGKHDEKITGKVLKLQWVQTSACCGDRVELRVVTKGLSRGAPLRLRFRRADRTSRTLDSKRATILGGRTRLRWVAYRRKYVREVKVRATQQSYRGRRRSDNVLELLTVPNVPAEQFGPKSVPATGYIEVMGPDGTTSWQPDPAHPYEVTYCYDREIRNGALIITRKIEFDVQPDVQLDADMLSQWKDEIEDIWDESWRLHRTRCRRKDDCDCAHHHGCCVYTVRIFVQWGSGHGEKVQLFAGAPKVWGSADWWYSNKWWTEIGNAASTTRAHEFGHLTGRFDEYPTGGCDPKPGAIIDDPVSVMGGGATVRPRHIAEFQQWFEVHAVPVVGPLRPLASK